MTEQNGIEDQRVVRYNPLISPYQLKTDIPRSDLAADTVRNGRKGIENILDRTDPRILVIAGPCSIHDTEAAMEYANKLRPVSEAVSDQFLVVMRTYFEKPRTSIGWKGFINDPYVNNSFILDRGLLFARRLNIAIFTSPSLYRFRVSNI